MFYSDYYVQPLYFPLDYFITSNQTLAHKIFSMFLASLVRKYTSSIYTYDSIYLYLHFDSSILLGYNIFSASGSFQ